MSTSTLRNQAYDFIFDKLVKGEYKPGQRLPNRLLAKEIGISFIPIREAISQLASEGLIEHRPKLGAFVAEADRQEIEELYDFRAALECHAAEQMAGRMKEHDLEEMTRHNDQLKAIAQAMQDRGAMYMSRDENDRWVLADAAFHMTLLRAQGNRRAIKTVGDLRLMTRIFARRRDDRPLHEAHRVCREHQNIIDALRRGDAEAARQAMKEQLRHGREVALELFDRRRATDAVDASVGNRYARDLQQRLHNMESDDNASDDMTE